MKELEFSGNVVEAEPTVIPQDKVWSNLEGHPECEKALSTPLDELSELSSGKVSNYYVAYAAIDLMNYVDNMEISSKKLYFSLLDDLIRSL